MLLAKLARGLSRVALAFFQRLGQWLVACLWQQQDADDADECAAGKDDMVQEVALLVVQLHDGCGQHAKPCTGKDQAKASTPAQHHSQTVHCIRLRPLISYFIQQHFFCKALACISTCTMLLRTHTLPYACRHYIISSVNVDLKSVGQNIYMGGCDASFASQPHTPTGTQAPIRPVVISKTHSQSLSLSLSHSFSVILNCPI